jgi:hypothetical protein
LSRTTGKVQTSILLILIFTSFGVYYVISNQMPITMATDKPVPTLTPDFFAQPLVQNDSNWAGYIIASDLQNPQPNVTSVNASWIVPEITTPP